MNKETLDYFEGDELAASVWQGKYSQEGDVTPDDMHKRMAKEFARIEKKYPESPIGNSTNLNLSKYGSNRIQLTEQSIYELFKDFKYIVPQGSVMSQLGAKSIGSLSNCFVIGQPHDSYSGIFQKDEEMAQLMKRRGGVGLDISTLRPNTAVTSNAAKTSTGAVSFMERFSSTTREVAQNGRRGALMLSIDVRHPDSPDFAVIKNDETKVTGANISIFLQDEFMEAVNADEDYYLRFPVDFDIPRNIEIEVEEGVPLEYNVLTELPNTHTIIQGMDNETVWKGSNVLIKKVRAKELYDTIVHSAWFRAEPGQLFINRFHNYSPDGVYEQYRGVTTNPCGEIFMQMYDACRLIAMNLYSFVSNPFQKNAYFNFEKFYEYSYEMQRLMDNLVDLELEYISAILSKIQEDIQAEIIISENTEQEIRNRYATEINLWESVKRVAANGRRTGSGFTALGDCLAALGLGYDSDEGIKMINSIMETKMGAELDCTIDLAVIRGSFNGWDSNLEFTIDETGVVEGKNEFYEFLSEKFSVQAERMYKFGRRNVSWSTVAPTGTVSLMTQTTSGLEPLFMPFYTRRVKVNPGEEGKRVDFTDTNGDTWMEQPVLHPKFKDWIYFMSNQDNKVFDDIDLKRFHNPFEFDYSKEELQSLFEVSPWFGSTANDIDWVKRVEIQGVIQKYISHSISSTINLPNDVTEAEVAEIYMTAWTNKLKGVTVYRDGCRSGVLISNDSITNESFIQHDAPKRPKVLPCVVHKSTSQGQDWLVIVGLLDEKPYEVFCIKNEYNLSNSSYAGDLIKVKRGEYKLDIKDTFVIEEFNSEMTDEQEAVTRLVSTSLRHGADIKYIVEQLGKTDGEMFSFTKSVARVLKKYIPDGTKGTVRCNECKSDNVVFEEGCNKCKDCGNSACG